MTSPLKRLTQQARTSLLDKLQDAVRPEFAVEMIHIDPDDPVFARGRCQVRGCDRGAWSLLLCNTHYLRFRRTSHSGREAFLASDGPIKTRVSSERVDTFDLRGLALQPRLEIAFAIQCRCDDRTTRLLPMMIARQVDLVRASGVSSVLEHSLEHWALLAHEHGITDLGGRPMGQLRYAWRHLRDLAEDTDAETEFAGDIWRAAVIGARPSSKLTQIRFDHLIQPWLREAVKRACRFRLGAGKAFGSVSLDERALRWFSTFLARQHPEVTDASGITRAVLEHYLSWIRAAPELSGNATNTYLVILRGFLEACHRHDWMPGLPGRAALYIDELPPRPRPLPRFIPEYVMTQLEDGTNLATLPDETTRNLVIVIQETGIRANDACALGFNPFIFDSSGWPCLKYYNAKMAAEQLVPLSQRAADAIRAQQDHLHDRWPEGCTNLFPSPYANPDGARAFAYGTLSRRLLAWQMAIDLRDEAGQPVSVTAHQFRHTLGTRLINAGVPQHVVRRCSGMPPRR